MDWLKAHLLVGPVLVSVPPSYSSHDNGGVPIVIDSTKFKSQYQEIKDQTEADGTESSFGLTDEQERESQDLLNYKTGRICSEQPKVYS